MHFTMLNGALITEGRTQLFRVHATHVLIILAMLPDYTSAQYSLSVQSNVTVALPLPNCPYTIMILHNANALVDVEM